MKFLYIKINDKNTERNEDDLVFDLFSPYSKNLNEKLKAIEIQYNYYLCRTLILIIKILNRQRCYSRCWNEKYNFNSISFNIIIINIKKFVL